MKDNNRKFYNDSYNQKEDALNFYKKELAKNNGDVNKTLLILNENCIIPFGFMEYFENYKECIEYLEITEDEFNKADCIKWSYGVIENGWI